MGSVAALMLLGGYVLSSTGPVALGAVRDVTGGFDIALWALAAISVAAPFGMPTINLAAITAALCAGPDAHAL